MVAYGLIGFLLVGGFVIPEVVAYVVLAYDVFWFYKSATLALASLISHARIEGAKKVDWIQEAKKNPNWKKVQHIILVVTVNEPLHTLRRTIKAIAKQDLPLEQLSIVIATEARSPIGKKNAQIIKKEFGKKFGHFFITAHELVAGEVIGKSSNERFAGIWVKQELVDRQGLDIDWLTITSCDADHVYHPKHFGYRTHSFINNPDRHRRFWQAAVQFYNNFWRLPATSRVANTFGSIWNTALLARTDRLIKLANYSTSLKMIDEVGYWDPDVIPEDYRIFFKCFYAFGGQVEVEPIYLPLHVDAAESTNFKKTFENQYEQFKRWAWGVSDDAYSIKKFFSTPNVSFWNKTIRLLRIIEDHFLWPVNWFFITLGMTIPSVFNKRFSRTVLGHTVPRLSSIILTASMAFLAIILFIDARQRPKRPADFPRWRSWLIPFEFVQMPVVGFFYTVLPGLDAQTRLMLGKYLEYRVTEKI
ncbi:glycosyltransferase family 2 protein [Patescibacteria group bacterium]|nr:glycosyltransferase family 2 protein [Patescibacteria group bacterium]